MIGEFSNYGWKRLGWTLLAAGAFGVAFYLIYG
jgi:hypothetical protein